MKFKIRFADQIVGLFIILSLVFLVFLVIMLGRTQRWFINDPEYNTILGTATGLSRNMTVLYRGFAVGNVKDFYLTEDDNVMVIFSIYEEYSDRVRLGSMVEMMVSPVGLGNQFILHAGRGNPLPTGSFLPVLGSLEARELISMGIAEEPRQDDSISSIMNRVNSILEDVNLITSLLGEALGPGSDITEIGKIVGSLQVLAFGLEDIPPTLERTISELQAELQPILSNVGIMLAALNEPDGLLYTVLDTEGEVYVNLLDSLYSISSTLNSLSEAAAFVPTQLPQLAGIIFELRSTLQVAEDVLIALTNNPLLRGGVPERPVRPGVNPRDLGF
ncbi:MAG: MCE family protein [Treponema sp.]|nr:MCE family protein [Treponema sp.]